MAMIDDRRLWVGEDTLMSISDGKECSDGRNPAGVIGLCMVGFISDMTISGIWSESSGLSGKSRCCCCCWDEGCGNIMPSSPNGLLSWVAEVASGNPTMGPDWNGLLHSPMFIGCWPMSW